MMEFACVDCPHERHFERARRLMRRVHLRAEPESVTRRRGAHRLDTDDEVQRACAEEGLEPEDLDERLNSFGWEDAWDNFTGPRRRRFTAQEARSRTP